MLAIVAEEIARTVVKRPALAARTTPADVEEPTRTLRQVSGAVPGRGEEVRMPAATPKAIVLLLRRSSPAPTTW
jgi:hypothetical protein